MSFQLATSPEGLRFSARLRVTPQTFEASCGVLGIFAASRVILLALVVAGTRLVGARWPPGSPIKVLLEASSRWDAAGYLAVARNGYWFDPILRQGTPTPFPLYPGLVRALSAVLPSVTVAGYVLSILAAASALALLYRLVALRLGRRDVALRACLLAALFPFSFVLSAADARPVVLLCAVLALLAEARGSSWLAAGMAAGAALAAPVGLVLWPALAIGRVARWARRGIVADEVASLVAALAVAVAALVGFRAHLAALGFPPVSPVVVLLGKPAAAPFYRAGLASAGPGETGLIALTLILAALALLTLPRAARTLGLAAAIYVAGLVGVTLARLLVAGDPDAAAATLSLAFPSAAVAAELLKPRAVAATALGVSAALLAGVTSTLVLASPTAPPEIAPARTFAETTLTTFHVDLARRDPAGVPPRDLYLNVDNAFVILGDQPPNRQYQPGGTIALPYYLYGLKEPEHGYMLSLRLRDLNSNAVARSDKVVWGSADASLDAPAAPATIAPDRYLQDNVDLTLSSNLPTGIYTLQAEVFALPSFARIPLVPNAGAPLDQIPYGDLVVARPVDLGPARSLEPSRPLRADSDVALSLLGYDARRDHERVAVSLYWEVAARPTHDYTVFVQALDGAGKVIAQSDSYPADGHFPTTHLQPGEVLRDVHLLTPLSASGGTVRLIAGLYRLDTMRRATFHRPGDGAASDHVDLGELNLADLR